MLKKKKNKKEITLNDLALMIGRGFNEAQEDRNKIKQDVLDIKNKLSSMERRIMFLEDKITEHSKILKELLREVKDIKLSIKKLQRDKEADRKRVIWLEKRIDRLEVKVGIK